MRLLQTAALALRVRESREPLRRLPHRLRRMASPPQIRRDELTGEPGTFTPPRKPPHGSPSMCRKVMHVRQFALRSGTHTVSTSPDQQQPEIASWGQARTADLLSVESLAQAFDVAVEVVLIENLVQSSG